MTSDLSRGRHDKLRANANQLLQRFDNDRRVVTSLFVAPVPAARRRAAPSEVSTTSWFTGVQTKSGTGGVGASDAGVVMDDERQVRAMAKQIKRLIIEDRRRGLGVGG